MKVIGKGAFAKVYLVKRSQNNNETSVLRQNANNQGHAQSIMGKDLEMDYFVPQK